MKNRILKWSLFLLQFGLFLGLLVYFPWLQNQFPSLQQPDLAGAYTLEDKPVWTVSGWLNGSYQQATQLYVQENRIARPLFVRLKNQLLHDGFHTSPNATIKMGQDNYLFGKREIDCYLGVNFVGEELVKQKADKLARIQEYLQAKGKALLVLLPPGKPEFIPEKLPPAYQNATRKRNNRAAYLEALAARNIPHIAFQHFDARHYKEPYLFPSGGLHWSHMAATLAMDSVITRIESLLGVRLKSLEITGVTLSDSLRPPDHDLGSVMNLMRPRPIDPMPYPSVRFISDSNRVQPRLLIVGDSFYRLMFDLGFHEALFSPQSTYWHYFTQSVSPQEPLGTPLDKSRPFIRAELESANLLLLVSGDSNLTQFGFGFIEALIEEITAQ